MEHVAHESTHKLVSEDRVARKHINATQEEKLAQHLGSHARKVAESYSQGSKSKPVSSDTWNNQNREALKVNNQKLAKTDGSQVKPWEYRVNLKAENGVGAFEKVGNQGGDKVQDYVLGQYETIIDKDGKAILDQDGKQQRVFVADTTITIPGISLNLFPVHQTKYSTATLAHLPGHEVQGVILFPKGPGSNIDGSNSIMKPGPYDLSDNPGSMYPGVLLFSRENPAPGEDKLYKRQGRLLHIGNHFGNTSGCGLPGDKFIKNYEVEAKETVRDASGKPKLDKKGKPIKRLIIDPETNAPPKDTFVANSEIKLKEIKLLLKLLVRIKMVTIR